MSSIQGISLNDLKPGALYLVFQDGTRFEFVPEEVRALGYEFLDDPVHVSNDIREAPDFQRCSVCPELHTKGYCHAFLPTVSYMQKIDQYPSFAPVTAIYSDQFSNSILVRETTLQIALQYVSILSLIKFCELGRQYSDLFFKVTPIMEPKEVAAQIYLNLYWLSDGDKQKLTEGLKKFVHEIQLTIKCQVKRLRLICKNDAVINAFVLTHVLTDLLNLNPEDALKQGFAEYQNSIILP